MLLKYSRCKYFQCDATSDLSIFFFFNDTAPTEIYTLSLHDALPICGPCAAGLKTPNCAGNSPRRKTDRKSTRLNSSHITISYAVFCLKKKKNKPNTHTAPEYLINKDLIST